MANPKYSAYSVSMLAADPDFRRWVTAGQAEDNAFWKQYLETYPEDFSKIEAAKALINDISCTLAHEHLPESQKRRMLLEIEERIEQQQYSIKRKLRIGTIAAAMAMLAVLYVAISLSVQHTETVQFSTGPNEAKSVLLPDGSSVFLQSNSQLSYPETWADEQRDVWLEGGAYFKVSKDIQAQSKFIVHTKGLDVEVYGTQFNVDSRQTLTMVSLHEGAVAVRIKDGNDNGQVLSLTPGEEVSYNPANGRLKKTEQKSIETAASWKDDYLLYDQAPLKTIIKDLEQYYQQPIHVTDSTLLQKSIKGAFPLHNLDEFLEALEIMLNLKISKQSDGIYLEMKHTAVQEN